MEVPGKYLTVAVYGAGLVFAVATSMVCITLAGSRWCSCLRC